jgi:hypothetical protein
MEPKDDGCFADGGYRGVRRSRLVALEDAPRPLRRSR